MGDAGIGWQAAVVCLFAFRQGDAGVIPWNSLLLFLSAGVQHAAPMV
ncbi:hypothetical protein N185_17675 [Sinorhizobium sp. GW3]|nr:hypothetical protein N185_17675 [Sinorhizobium sp. GW3]